MRLQVMSNAITLSVRYSRLGIWSSIVPMYRTMEPIEHNICISNHSKLKLPF